MKPVINPHLRIERNDQTLLIEWPWSKVTGSFFILGAVALSSVVYAATQLPTAGGAPRDPSNILGLWIVGSLFVFGLLVFGLMHFANRTVIEASKSELVCRGIPITLWSPKQISVEAIDHFLVKRSESKRPAGMLCAIGKDSQVTRVVLRTPDIETANQICEELQKFYGFEVSE